MIKNLHGLIASSIRDPHAYLRRSRGFISELKFKEKCKKDKIDYLDGGWIFFKGDALAKEKETVYATASFDDPEKYTDFYSELSKCPIIKSLFFLKIKSSDWNNVTIKVNGHDDVNIPEPKFDVYNFLGNKFVKSDIDEFVGMFPVIKPPRFYRIDTKSINLLDYLSEFSEDVLTELYVERFLIDYLLKGKVSYGMDFDGIIVEGKQYFVVETKEKDPGPSNRNSVPKTRWFFGWDTLRMLWYLYLTKTTKINCYSAILEINNQKDRKFVAWKRCELLKLCRAINYSNAITGGVGMGTTKGSTTIAPYSAFEEF